MDNKTLEALFLKKLNSLSEEELLERLNDVPPTGLGELIHEDAVYSRLVNRGMSLSSPIHRVKIASKRNKMTYSNNTNFLCDGSRELEQADFLDMAA
jgi:hypothetical protein